MPCDAIGHPDSGKHLEVIVLYIVATGGTFNQLSPPSKNDVIRYAEL
jgi:hypothetical protein